MQSSKQLFQEVNLSDKIRLPNNIDFWLFIETVSTPQSKVNANRGHVHDGSPQQFKLQRCYSPVTSIDARHHRLQQRKSNQNYQEH